MTTGVGAAYRRKLSDEDLSFSSRDPHEEQDSGRAPLTSRRRHDLIVGNIAGELRASLRDVPSGEVYPVGMRVLVQGQRNFAPDVTVVCQTPRFEDGTESTLVNPTILFEVVSETTEAQDRGEKFEVYATIASLAEYVLVSTRTPRVERFLRHADGSWTYRAYGMGDVVPLSTAGCQLKVDEVYLKAFPKNGI